MKKFISVLLAVLMLLSICPLTSFATMLPLKEIDAALVLNGYEEDVIKAMSLTDVLRL